MLRASVLAALAAATLTGACATERDVIDRTQPNGLSKELFQGEWYYQQTVVEIPGTWSFTFVGETNWQGMERVRWDIQEDWLYARRSYEKIKNAEGAFTNADADPEGKPYMGAILAAYRIDAHFDLKRAYNPSTGEEYNVLEENMSDNPWYDRQFMRVNWSANYATEFMFLVDDVSQDPVAYYVQDSSDPDYPVFDPGAFDADGRMIRQPYIDVTNTVMTQPGMTYFEEYGESYPTCWLFSRATADCTTEIIKVRSSFLRIDPNREYVAKPYKGTVTDFFGLFAQDRLVYDPLREVNERYKERYAQLHNLWLDWIDENGDLIADPAQRGGVRPMIYYVHNWPAELQPSLRQTEAEWDGIFQRAVGAARGETYTDRVFVACNWPLQADDDINTCVPAEFILEDGTVDPRFNPRLGDIRYNWIAYVDKYYDGFALLGLGPSNTDPLTGQVISAGAYLYIYNDIVSQTTTDQIRLLNGDLDMLEYIDVLDIEDWSTKAKAQARTMQQRVVLPEIVHDFAAMQRDNMGWSKGLLGGAPASEWAQWEGKPMRLLLKDHVMPAAHDIGMFSPDYDDSEGRLASLAGTPIEHKLMNDEILIAAGIAPGTPTHQFTEELFRKASVARIGPVQLMAALDRKKQYFANVKNVDLMASADDGYIGLANQYEGMPEEDLRAVIRDDVYHAVLAHELGHSFNLHHNFGGTEDVLNYKDEYWTLRDDGNIAPRWQDPITDAELDGRIYSYAYSSIMDYSRLTLDAFGPGKYDAAAILLGYGDKVERYVNTGSAPVDYFNEWSVGRGGILLFFLDQPRAWHYTQWFNTMGHDLHEDDNREFVDASRIDWESGLDDELRPRVPYIYCSPYSSDIGNGCFTRDYGADEYERVQHHISAANTWYISRAFTRYAVGASPEEYVGRTYGRTYQRLKGYNDYYALIIGLLQSIGAWDDASIQAFLTDPLEGWASYTIAEHDLFNFLLETIMRPNVDAFSMATDGAGEQYLFSSVTGVGQRTGLLSGRYFSTAWWDSTFGDSCGMYFWECLHHYGFYLDKIMALEALTDANTYFVARDTAEDVRQWRINFYDNFAPQIDAFMGGLMAQDYSEVAPGYLVGDNLAFPDYALMTPKSGGQTIDPAAGFTVQLYVAVLGMARFQNNFDKSFLDTSRMWLDGSAFEINVPDTCEFVSPFDDGRVFEAIAYADGMGVAQRMIGRANAALARSNYCTAGCVAGLTAADRAKADAELNRYTELLEVMVDLTGYYEVHTQGYGDPYNPGQVP